MTVPKRIDLQLLQWDDHSSAGMTIKFQLMDEKDLNILIDKKDIKLVSRHRWHIKKYAKYYYAVSWRANRIGAKCGTHILIHRLIMGAKKGEIVDHINGNGLDNRRINLRLCSIKENIRNMHARRGVSQYKGVYWFKRDGVWVAQITVDYKNIYLGRHNSEKEAAMAYDRAAIAHYKEFANLNFK